MKWPELTNFRKIALAGTAIAALGTFSNLFGFQVVRHVDGSKASDFVDSASLNIQLFGLLVASIGGVALACTESPKRVTFSALFIALGGFLMVEILNVGVMTKTAIFLTVFIAAELTAACMLLSAGVRFATKHSSSR